MRIRLCKNRSIVGASLSATAIAFQPLTDAVAASNAPTYEN